MSLISIIIPVYNQEKYLDRSLPSALSQTYSNIEIICINDGSTDNSLRILKNYQIRDERIKIIDQSNSGLVHAVSVGIREAMGEYVCFLDPDDYIGPDFVRNFANNIGSYDFVSFGHYFDWGMGKIEENKITLSKECNEDALKDIRDNLIWDMDSKSLSKRILNSRWNKMYKRDCIRKFVDIYDTGRECSFGEDTFFTYLLLQNAKAGFVSTKLNDYYYNTSNSNSMMSSGDIKNHIKRARISYAHFNKLLQAYNDPSEQSLALYFFLIESLFQKTEHLNKRINDSEFNYLYNILKRDNIYQKALIFLKSNSTGSRHLVYSLRHTIKSPRLYKLLLNLK
jgi:glycosyltransferase involved in cell wall biosynthesis